MMGSQVCISFLANDNTVRPMQDTTTDGCIDDLEFWRLGYDVTIADS